MLFRSPFSLPDPSSLHFFPSPTSSIRPPSWIDEPPSHQPMSRRRWLCLEMSRFTSDSPHQLRHCRLGSTSPAQASLIAPSLAPDRVDQSVQQPPSSREVARAGPSFAAPRPGCLLPELPPLSSPRAEPSSKLHKGVLFQLEPPIP